MVGDLGTHAFHLLRYITGLTATRVSAELSTLVPGRRVFDNAADSADAVQRRARHAVGEHGGNG